MMRIAICDDEATARDALRIQLEKVLIEEYEEIVYEFSSGIHAASWLEKHPSEADLLFLDMEMKGYSGMETAEKIRTFDNDLLIVFVTGYSDYVFDGYRVGATDYIIKPVSTQKLRELLHRVRAKLAEKEPQTFTIKNMDGTWRFKLCDILYFYSDKRKVNLVTKKGEYPFYAKLDEIDAKLCSRFVRIHQRYLVNPDAVEYLGGDSVTVGGAELPCSRRYRETATSKIARSMMGGMPE
ncbi:MAG: LytTR family DNA-binding domain-containing protein [Eubacterium sp.]|nr:LytTR family DNA-binding domain-containing protein [Eubacterium sp.]